MRLRVFIKNNPLSSECGDNSVLEEMLSALYLHSIPRSFPLQLRPKHIIKSFLVVIKFKPFSEHHGNIMPYCLG